MKLLICGSRRGCDYELLTYSADALKPTEIIHGGAFGVDSLAHIYATIRKLPVTIHKPDWDKYGKAAGPIRNRIMVDECDFVLALWDGKSKGTKSTIDYAKQINKPLNVVLTNIVPAQTK